MLQLEKSLRPKDPAQLKINKQINRIVKADRGQADRAVDHELLKKEGCVFVISALVVKIVPVLPKRK